ncbi:MAG: hypothetical protein WAN74_03125 [Thermoplasmata archaeon]
MNASMVYRSAGLTAIIVAALMLGSAFVPVTGLSHGTAASTAPLTPVGAATPATASTAPISTPSSDGPHPGTLDVYEVAPGGAKTEDPSVAYDTLSYEPIINVYQTLVAYNGSSTTQFVPELATCVPGSAQCTTLYGSPLIQNNATTGYPQYFTFVLDSSAQFYDPSTGAHWGVYPSDVMFTLSRTMSFSELPGVGTQNGWIQTQALVPFGNPSYDGGIHYPYNNTPANVLSSMLVNDSAYCPAAAMSQNGCITFNAAGGGTDWPFFLELVADPLGSGIEPCGWFTYVGAGVPGFTGTGAANGDGPCKLPGGATSTTQPAFQNYVATVSPTSWDTLQLLAATSPLNPQPAVKESMVGSGPYYLEAIDNAIGYVLEANPAYHAPTGCAGQPGCQPLAGAYQGTVNVFWEETDQQGIANYQAGQADLAGIQLPAHVSTLTTLLNAGKVDLTYIPTISVFFMPYNLNFNVTVTNTLTGNPKPTNVPGDFFSQIGLRQFITNAYPYATINSSLIQAGGISTGFGYGGALPKYLGNYYAYNISWPQSDPSTNPSVVGGAAWWWAQANNASSPYYDAELAACTTANPCIFPITSETGSTFYDAAIVDLIGEIESLTGNRLTPYTFDITFAAYLGYAFAAPGSNGLPLWNLGWAPDYPDPTDYVVPMYLPDSTYTYGDSVSPELALPQFNSASCPFAANYTDASSAWAALVYYHSLQQLPNKCQGIAYGISTYWYTVAGPLSVGAQRTLDYQMANQLDFLLSLYIWNFQSSIPESYAPWINGASLNANVMQGGGGDNTWYTVGYASAVSTASVTSSGLPAGTAWTATVGYSTQTGTGSSLSFSLAPGTYNYYVWPANGYGVSPANGTVKITLGNTTSVSATFTSYGSTPLVPVTFSQVGIVSGTASWAAVVPGVGAWYTTSTSVTLKVPAGTYPYTVEPTAGYTVASPTGTVTAGPSGATATIPFVPNFPHATYAVVVTESGLGAGASWSVTLNGLTQTSTQSSITFYQTNGSYAYTIGSISGYTASPASGAVSTSASLVVVPVVYTAIVTPGTLAITLQAGGPSSATLSINGATGSTITAGQTVTVPVSAGTYSITLTAGGYYTYYNNASVLGGATTSVPVTMNSNSTGSTSSSSGISNTAWALIGVFIVLTVIFLVTTVYYMRRAKPPASPPPSWSSGSGTQGGNMPPPSK